MKKYFTTSVGRLRLVGFLEGVSLLILVFVAVPLKYIWHNPELVKTINTDEKNNKDESIWLAEVPLLQMQKPEMLNYIPYGQEH